MSDHAVVIQDDPAGSYFSLDVASTSADQSVPRAKHVALRRADGTVTGALTGFEVDSIEVADDEITATIPAKYADSLDADVFAFIHPVAENGVLGPKTPAGALSTLAVEKPPHVDSAEIMGIQLAEDPVQYFGGGTYVTRTGNSLLVAVLWDPTGGITITSVKFGDSVTFSQIGTTQTIGGSSGYKLAWYLAANLTATNPLIALPLVGITFSGAVAEYQASLMEIRDGVGGGTDALVSAEGNDAFPTTAASAGTTVSLEVVIAALALDSQITAQQIPLGDDGMVMLTANTSSHLSLVIYRKNVIDLTNIGFATTLDQPRGWAVATASFS